MVCLISCSLWNCSLLSRLGVISYHMTGSAHDDSKVKTVLKTKKLKARKVEDLKSGNVPSLFFSMAFLSFENKYT